MVLGWGEPGCLVGGTDPVECLELFEGEGAGVKAKTLVDDYKYYHFSAYSCSTPGSERRTNKIHDQICDEEHQRHNGQPVIATDPDALL